MSNRRAFGWRRLRGNLFCVFGFSEISPFQNGFPIKSNFFATCTEGARSDQTLRRSRAIVASRRLTTPAYLVIGWPFIVDYWQKRAFELPRNTGTLPVRPTSLPSLHGCSLGRTPARRFTILLLRSRSIPELGARNNRATS